MRLLFALVLSLLAALIYANPSLKVGEFNENEMMQEDEPVEIEEAVNDDADDDDEATDDDDDEVDEEEDLAAGGDGQKNCSRTLRKELGKCLKHGCRFGGATEGMVTACVQIVIHKCNPDEDTKNCINKLPVCMSKRCKDRRLGKPGRKCFRRFRKCVKKAEGSGMELL
ncbi:uncharacterized protein LOC144653941 [Oculina patagonica]